MSECVCVCLTVKLNSALRFAPQLLSTAACPDASLGVTLYVFSYGIDRINAATYSSVVIKAYSYTPAPFRPYCRFGAVLHPISVKSLRHCPMVARKLLFQLLGCGPIVPVVMLLVRIQKQTSGQQTVSKILQHSILFSPEATGNGLGCMPLCISLLGSCLSVDRFKHSKPHVLADPQFLNMLRPSST